MKIIHCSDLHLDSKMETNLDKERARERKNEILLTFERMVQYAKENDVKIIIIAGDLFDKKTVTVKAKNTVKNAIISNPEIDYKDSVSKQNQISGKYTICLANPPFKGTIDAESINDNLKAITNTNLSSKSLWMKLSYYLISLCRITLVDAKIVLIMKTCHVDNPSRRRDYAKSIFR